MKPMRMGKNTGLVRRIDKEGRITIPENLCQTYQLEVGESVKLCPCGNTIIICNKREDYIHDFMKLMPRNRRITFPKAMLEDARLSYGDEVKFYALSNGISIGK